MKKYWIISAITLLFVSCQESLEDRCAREAQEYTRKNCPVRMDNTTTLDSMTFERTTHTLHYHCIAKKIDAVSILKKELKNTTTLKLYKDNHYRFAYTFRSEKDPSNVLIDVVFTDKDY